MSKRKIKYFGAFTILILAVFIVLLYKLLPGDAVKPKNGKTVLYISTGATYGQVMDSINRKLAIKNRKIFAWVAERKKYPELIRPGKYVIENSMSYIGFINRLRSGNQTPVNVTINTFRNINQLAGKAGRLLEADSSHIASFLSDPENYRKDGFTRENIIAVFIPDTYRFFWNTSAGTFYSRMLKEYNKFWNEERLSKAKEKNLSPVEVSILASIVDDEVAKAAEKPKIAGVYLNRLRKGMPLQACPTIKFALNDFSITRILTRHLQVNSPYNTYKFRGFPPGPIGCATKEGIDAVLNAEKSDYLFFAAKADFSGYHNFSRTLAEHNRYAAEYQRELDRRKIFK
jgi:UPF0755 protein